MKEIKPPSAIIVEKIHERYKRKRAQIGPPTESASEPVLTPLKEKGVIFGFAESWQICADFLKNDYQGSELWLATALFVMISGVEFVLITLGWPVKSIDENGHWKILDKYADKEDFKIK